MAFTVRILGSCEVHVPSGTTVLSGVKPATLLTILLSRANRPVSVDSLVELLWEDQAPRSAVANLRTYVLMLRGALTGGPVRLERVSGGYQLWVADADCDHLRFAELLRTGAVALDADRPRAALEHLEQGLALWRGTEAAAGVPRHGALATWLEAIDDERLRTLERIAEAWIAVGEPHRAMPELDGLLATAPLRSRGWWLRMLAHHRLGEHGRALAVYRQAVDVFRRELGIDADPQLTDLYRSLLRWDPDTAGPEPAGSEVIAPGPVRGGYPQTRPAVHRAPDPPPTVGRREILATIHDAVRAPVTIDTVRVIVVHGPPGVGTSTVVLRAARDLTDHFPDGQVYLDLRAMAGHRSSGAALRGTLRMLGVGQPPDDPQEAGDLLRTLSFGQRFMLVVDNATAPEQVRPLLSLDPGCCVVVASGYALGALQASRRVRVPPLSVPASAELLRGLLDPGRASPAELDRLAALCAGLPLALRIAAARLIDQPALTATKLIARLRDDRLALAELETDDLSLRVRLHEVLGAATVRARRAFPQLAFRTVFGLPAAALRIDSSLVEAEAVLDELTRVHLVTQDGPGRYLMRRFARLLAADLVPANRGYLVSGASRS